MVIIGLTGKAYSGKDTVATMIGKNAKVPLSFRYSFAQPIKTISTIIARNLFGTDIPTDLFHPLVKEDIIKKGDFWGKYNVSPRSLAQDIGKSLRDVIGQDLWVDMVVAKILRAHQDIPQQDYDAKDNSLAVITDVRYDNEANRLRELKSVGHKVLIVNVHRSKELRDIRIREHESEAGVSDDLIDAVITNNGTKEELEDTAREVIRITLGDKYVRAAE